jgi:hypothetical protein
VTSSRHIPADSDLVYFTVRCHLAPIVADLSQDSDYDPNTARIDAIVTFTPKLRSGEVIHSHTSTPPTGFLPLPITAMIDDGYLKLRSKPDAGAAPLPGTLHGLKARLFADGNTSVAAEVEPLAALNYAPVRLLGNSPALELVPEQPLYYDFSFTNIKIDGKATNYTITGGTFEAPWADEVIDLLDWMPLTPGPYAVPTVVGPQGPQGIPGPATVDVGSTVTSLPGSDAVVTNSGDTSAAVFDFVIPRGETGPPGTTLNEVASAADLPAGQAPGTVFLTVDTGDLYRADGTKATGWERISQRVLSTGIEDSSAVGRSVVTAVDEKAARTAISAVGRNDNVVNVRDYGAKGDWNTTTQTGTDDSPAFEAAYAAARANSGSSPNGSRTVYVPPGRYRLTKPWIIFDIGSDIRGGQQSMLFIDHLDGPGIHVQHRETHLEGLWIYCSNTRKNAPFDNKNFGVLVSGADQANFSMTHTRLNSMTVTGHPSHGFVICGYGYQSRYENLQATECKGHGYVIDGGESIGKTNISSPGIATVRHCWSLNNEGHALMMGNPAAVATPFRILVDNFESADNGKNPAIKITPDDAWLFGENCEVRRSAFGGLVTGGTGHYGVRIAGRGWILINNRFINCERSVTFSGDTLAGTSPAGSTLESARVVGTQPVAIVIEPGSVNNRISLPLTSNMTVPVQDNAAVAAGNVVVTLPPISSLTLAATQNDYQWPLGKATLRLTGAAGGSTITGLAWPSSGRQVRLVNVSVAPITLAHQNTGSVAANRFLSPTAADVVLQSNGSATVEYDPGSSRWRIVGFLLGTAGAVTTKDEVPVEDVVIDGGEAHEYEFLEHLLNETDPDATDAAAPTAKKTK